MIKAGLLPLVAIGEMNKTFPNNNSNTQNIIDCQSNISHSFIRSYDAVKIQGLIIPTKNNLNNITSIEINIGGNTIFSIPFDIIKANNTMIIEDDYYITIPDEIFGNYYGDFVIKNKFLIPLICLRYHDVEFILIARDDNQFYNFNYQIMIHQIYYQSDIRKNMVQKNKSENIIYQYQSFPIVGNSNTIDPRLLMTGIYIKSLSSIIKYELLLNNILYRSIEKNMILYNRYLQSKRSLWTKKHSLTLEFSLNTILPLEIIYMIEEYVKDKYEYLYYFPIADYNHITINCDKVDNIKINLISENEKYDGKIYVKNLNLLVIHDGIVGIRYMN